MTIPKGLPERYEAMFEQLGGIRAQTLAYFRSFPPARLHLAALDRCLALLDELSAGSGRRPAAVAGQTLVRRLVHLSLSALTLLADAFYQGCMAVQRDTLETGFLLEFLLHDSSRCAAWCVSTRADRTGRGPFAPGTVRRQLNDDGADRDAIYTAFCEHASHPTLQGGRLLADDKAATVGVIGDANRFTSSEVYQWIGKADGRVDRADDDSRRRIDSRF